MSFLREASSFLGDVVQVVDTLAKLNEFEKEEEAAGRITPKAMKFEPKMDLDSMSIGQLVDAIFDETEKFMDSPELADLMDRYAEKHRLGVYAELDEAEKEAEEWVKNQPMEVHSIPGKKYWVNLPEELFGKEKAITVNLAEETDKKD